MRRTERIIGVVGRAGGFTLVELMVVIVILGLLAGIGVQQVRSRLDKAKVQSARAQVSEFASAMEQIMLDTGQYPSSSQGLSAIFANPGLEDWQGPYINKKELPKDPWKNEYVYLNPGGGCEFEIVSYGKDGVAGGDGFGKDISSCE